MLKYTSNTTASDGIYHTPELIFVEVKDTSIELIFRKISKFVPLGAEGEVKIYKEIYKPVKGKIKHVKTIEGEYVPAKEESYHFHK